MHTHILLFHKCPQIPPGALLQHSGPTCPFCACSVPMGSAVRSLPVPLCTLNALCFPSIHTQISIPSLCTQGQVLCFPRCARSDPSIPSVRSQIAIAALHPTSFAPLLVLLCSCPSCITSLPNPVPQRPQLSQLAYRHLLASVFQQVHSSV